MVFISQNGMVQRTSVRGISRYGRASQGVRVMNLRADDQVSAVALVVESDAATAASVIEDDGPDPVMDVEVSEDAFESEDAPESDVQRGPGLALITSASGCQTTIGPWSSARARISGGSEGWPRNVTTIPAV